ncbi:MAG TPA: ATP-binding protein [Candidatus Aphodovivens avistercoris]|nr:ATP-binding protein [Candidatus Aphodovivens avistercoris]
MYINREIETTIQEMLRQFKVVLVTGARQVGKTTVLENCLKDTFSYATLENPIEAANAENDSLLFFETHSLPLIIDEIQRVPSLFQTTKFIVDQSSDRGQMVLIGSQTYHLMKGVSESLAGRIGIIEMSGLSTRELIGSTRNNGPYIPHAVGAVERPGSFDLWERIQRGSMPELCASDIPWDRFWTSYTQAYLERDVRDLINLKNESKFYDFMVAAAACSGQLFNASDIANAINVDYKTVQSWLSILQASGIVRLLRPFWPNIGKSLTKTPKLYFMDTGLICHLTRWTTPDQLRNGAVAGHVFETFVVSEVLKSYMNAGANLRDVWFYRDTKKREIDLVIQEGRILHPVEVKTAATVKADAIKNFKCLESMEGYEVGFGHVICQTPEPYYVTRNVQAIPVWTI